MNWFKEHKLISILLLILLVLILIFVITTKSGAGKNTLSDGLNKGVQAVSSGFTKVEESIKGTFKGIFKYQDLEAEIESLKQENDNLKKELQEVKLTREELSELSRLSEVLNFEYTEKKFDIVTGSLTSKNMSLWINTFTINIGSKDGVSKNAPVINSMGLVGKIQDVGDNWAKVLCLTDDETKVSFRCVRDNSLEGICYGDGTGELKGYMIDADATIAEGDILITSGLGIYPEGIVIGTVKTISFNSNTLLKEIVVESTCDFKYIDKVSVIR